MTIHESSPSTWFIGRYARHYSISQYFPGVNPGSVHRGNRCENLERLTFADNAFDIFITQDVLEHVFDPAKAISEIHRVLKPGGAHVFTAPMHRGLGATTQRASIDSTDVITYILPEMYHGNPVGDGRVLVTWDYGNDFEKLLSDWAGVTVETHGTRNRNKGIDALFNEVFVIRKP